MEPIRIYFPNFKGGIRKDKNNPGSIYNFICIKNGHALLNTPSTLIAIDLYHYFLNFQTVNEDFRPQFDVLMEWLEGKKFTSDFYAFLTGWIELSIVDEKSIWIKGDKFEKVLIYEDTEIDLTPVFNLMKNNAMNLRVSVESVAMSNVNLRIIHDSVGMIIGSNPIVFEYIPAISTCRFTIDGMPFIFGVVLLSNEAAKRPGAFEGFTNFARSINL